MIGVLHSVCRFPAGWGGQLGPNKHTQSPGTTHSSSPRVSCAEQAGCAQRSPRVRLSRFPGVGTCRRGDFYALKRRIVPPPLAICSSPPRRRGMSDGESRRRRVGRAPTLPAARPCQPRPLPARAPCSGTLPPSHTTRRVERRLPPRPIDRRRLHPHRLDRRRGGGRGGSSGGPGQGCGRQGRRRRRAQEAQEGCVSSHTHPPRHVGASHTAL